jgi:hypothetical protein
VRESQLSSGGSKEEGQRTSVKVLTAWQPEVVDEPRRPRRL